MAWNFRRRKKIAPGVYINMSKKGVSTTVGRKGATMTFGPNGTYLNTSIPGTGMYNRRKLSSTSSSPAPQSNINFTNHVPRKNTGRPLILVLFIIFNSLFLADLVAAEFELFYEICGINDGKIFLLGNIGLAFFGIILICIRHSVQKRQSVFSYKREKRNAQKVLDSLSFNDKDMRNILKAYIQCLTINEEFDKEQEIIEELKKSTDQKALELVPIHEVRLEALKVSLEKVQYNADVDLSKEQKQAFKLFTDSFEILCNSDKIWFETGITPRGLIQRAETKFEFGVFDYIKSEFEIPAIRIPNTSINFYIYPRFIIRTESTTNFKVYPIEKVEIEYTSLNFQEEYKPHLTQPKDATLVSSNFLYETKKGEPDRRHAYNPLYITYDYGKLTIPRFGNNWSMNFYVSNRDSAKYMQEAYAYYKRCLQGDIDNLEIPSLPEAQIQEGSAVSLDLSQVETPCDMPNYFDITIAEDKFNEISKVCENFEDFNILINEYHKDFYDLLREKGLNAENEDEYSNAIKHMIYSDIYVSMISMQSSMDIKDKEGLARFMLVTTLNSKEKLTFSLLSRLTDEIVNNAEQIGLGAKDIFGNNNNLTLPSFLKIYNEDLYFQYLIYLYRFLSITAKADDIVKPAESSYLRNIMTLLHEIDKNVNIDNNYAVTFSEKVGLQYWRWDKKLDNLRVGQYVVKCQKCVISDIQAEFSISRDRVLKALKVLENKKVIITEGRTRKVLIQKESDLLRLLRGEEMAIDTFPIIKSDQTPIDNDPLPIDSFDISRIEHPDPILQDAIKFVISEKFISTSDIQRKFEIGFNRALKISEQLETLGILGPDRGEEGREVLVNANGKSKEKTTKATKQAKSTSKSSTSELDALVGLSSVKEEIKTLSNFIKIQQKRKEQGLKSSSVSYHCVFTGNPGTGKTTVARIVAQIYKDLGILSKGHLVETDRAGLVAEYVGQTAVKTNKIIDSALDGVLFIDEAYSLIGTGQDYGKEAIATLLKRMEDDRDRLVVILAGYSKEMQDFINTNPGLQSRFNRYIEFPDYSAEELLQIFEKNVARFDYKLEKDACMAMAKYFQNAVENKDANFGNARFVRNIFEKTLEKQANRLSTDPDLDTEELTLITKEDLPIE